jgi:isopenicillin N synthase-like dioxygenase
MMMSCAPKIATIDLDEFTKSKTSSKAKVEIEKLIESLKKFGVIFVKDRRIKEEQNTIFLDMLEKYFEQSEAQK